MDKKLKVCFDCINCDQCPTGLACSANSACKMFKDKYRFVELPCNVKHGEWIDNCNGTFTCSLCGGRAPKMHYCGNCGAKMV